MFLIETQIHINAPPAIIWEVLTDHTAYAQWNTLLQVEEGSFKEGERPRLTLSMPDGPSYSFRPTILICEPDRLLVWKAVTGIPGIFDGMHEFRLFPVSEHVVRLINREEYRGLFAPIMKQIPMMKSAPAGFEQMNREIKLRAEALSKR